MAGYGARLRQLRSQLLAPAAGASAVEHGVPPGTIKYEAGEQRQRRRGAGISRIRARVHDAAGEVPPDQIDEIVEFFNRRAPIILGAFSQGGSTTSTPSSCARSARPARVGLGDVREGFHVDQGMIYSQPLSATRARQVHAPPGNFPSVRKILNGEDKPRFMEFNFREAPEGAQRDERAPRPRLPRPATREPYGELRLGAIHYLTDVNENTPAFAVVPRSVRWRSVRRTRARGLLRAAALQPGNRPLCVSPTTTPSVGAG